MCEMYVRTEDRINKESVYVDAKCYKRGDVVTIQEDGWPWGNAEINNGTHTIVKVPGVPSSKMSALVVPEIGDPLLNRVLQLRGFRFDIDTFESSGRPALTEISALSLKVKKVALLDPDVIG